MLGYLLKCCNMNCNMETFNNVNIVFKVQEIVHDLKFYEKLIKVKLENTEYWNKFREYGIKAIEYWMKLNMQTCMFFCLFV